MRWRPAAAHMLQAPASDRLIERAGVPTSRQVDASISIQSIAKEGANAVSKAAI